MVSQTVRLLTGAEGPFEQTGRLRTRIPMMQHFQLRESPNCPTVHPSHNLGYCIHPAPDWHIAAYLLKALPAEHLNRPADAPFSAGYLLHVFVTLTIKQKTARNAQALGLFEFLNDSFVIERLKRNIGVKNAYVAVICNTNSVLSSLDRVRLGGKCSFALLFKSK